MFAAFVPPNLRLADTGEPKMTEANSPRQRLAQHINEPHFSIPLAGLANMHCIRPALNIIIIIAIAIALSKPLDQESALLDHHSNQAGRQTDRQTRTRGLNGKNERVIR